MTKLMEQAATTPSSSEADATAGKVVLTATDIAHQYGNLQVVENANLTIRIGESVAIVGPSGAGKSTLLRLLLGLEKPTRGKASLHLSPAEIGAVFQEDSVLPWLTVDENLELLNKLHHAPVDQECRDRLLQSYELADFSTYFPRELSGGMKQKVGLTRLLLYKPRFYVLDEAMANMDDLSRFAFCDTLHSRVAGDGCSILFVTHNLIDAIHLADRVLIGTSRPLRFVKEFINPLPRMRDYKSRFTREFQEVVEQLQVWIGQH